MPQPPRLSPPPDSGDGNLIASLFLLALGALMGLGLSAALCWIWRTF